MSSGNASPARTETSLGLTRTPSLHSARNRKRFLDFARNDKNGDVTSRCEVKRAASGAVARMTSLFRFGILALIWFVTSTHTVAEPTPAPSEHTNRLAHEKSPYLLQHVHNPVDWYPWGEEAFAKARRENKPIFLSVGYYTCHWCHVMERESYSNPEIAALLNRWFIAVKVDREERPDIDETYMAFVEATTGSGGWPMNVVLTTDLKPFFGGTYFPSEQLKQLLPRIADLWKTRRSDLERSARTVTAQLQQKMTEVAGTGTIRPQVTANTFQQINETYDTANAGFGS